MQNIKLQGNEWTGNVIAKEGRIHLYTSNPSSPMQIDYKDGSSKTEIFRWIKAFVAAKRLSGSLCFDFMEHPVTGEIIADSVQTEYCTTFHFSSVPVSQA